jgi:hypothetical protein
MVDAGKIHVVRAADILGVPDAAFPDQWNPEP